MLDRAIRRRQIDAVATEQQIAVSAINSVVAKPVGNSTAKYIGGRYSSDGIPKPTTDDV
jgi:hypothetical protein